MSLVSTEEKKQNKTTKKMVFLICYINDILFIGNDAGALSTKKVWFVEQFDIKDLGKEANYILESQDHSS